MKNKWVFLLLLLFIIPLVIAQISDEEILTITITADGKAKVNQILHPATYLSSINVEAVSENISKILATDEKNVFLGTTLEGNSLKILSLGAAKVNLSYEADIISYESGIFKVKYQNNKESTLILPPLSNLVGLNSIPKDIDDKTFRLSPGSISLSYSIREVGLQSFDVTSGGISHPIELMTGAKISDFKGNNNEISFLVEDKATILAIIPTTLFEDVDDASLNGDDVDFKVYYQNSTHSWIRIDPHENGLVKISAILTANNDGGGCLIATATYGSEMSSQVQFLREIRDNTVMSTALGTAFMSGFNQLYYSFSPTIADLERQNPIFKEIVKIGITPLLSTLSILSFVEIESEQEMLGYGIMIILMNVGIYFILPVLTFVGIKTIRTRQQHHSNQMIILNLAYRLRMNKSLFGILLLFVMLVTVPTAMSEVFAQAGPPPDPPPEPKPSPLEIALTMTMEQALAALGDDAPPSAEELYQIGLDAMIAALELESEGMLDEAEESAIVAMALFEDTTTIMSKSGFGEAFDTASEQGLENGQGLGVGGISPGIMKQLNFATIFAVFEDINESEGEGERLKSLILSNNINVDFSDYDGEINLAKQALANGDIPNAQAKLEIANELLEQLYNDMNELASEVNEDEVQEFAEKAIQEIENLLENGNQLGLTQNTINELTATLETLRNGDTNEILEKTSGNSEYAKEMRESKGNSENAPGQNDDAPGNSENAPGQNDDAPGNSPVPNEIPGQGAAGENPSEQVSENAQGLGFSPKQWAAIW